MSESLLRANRMRPRIAPGEGPRLTLCFISSILRSVLILSRRLSALLVTLALSAGNVAVCAGWMATPEARMACCSEAGPCPMHKSDSPNSNSSQAVSQAEADSCCAASEDDQSSQSSSTFASTISVAVLGTPSQLPTASDVAPRAASRAAVPLPPSHVPKHVLLSVFLV
jgi:hypothetical protein